MAIWMSDACPAVVAAEIITSEDFYEGYCWMILAPRSAASSALFEVALGAYPEAPPLPWPYLYGDPDDEELLWGVGSETDITSAKTFLLKQATAAGCLVDMSINGVDP